MKLIKIATHDGIFHADEVFALAVLKLSVELDGDSIEIVRTRDLDLISSCHMAVDVGGVYDQISHFDHHQKDKPGFRENGIPYASFGLVWKHFGSKLSQNEEVISDIDSKLVMPIDAVDNGVNISSPVINGVREYGISLVFSAISKSLGDDKTDLAFQKSLEFATLILIGEIKKGELKIEGEKEVTRLIIEQNEPEVLVLEQYSNWETAVSKFKNIKLVVYPGKEIDRWCIQTARDDVEVFGSDRVSFPKGWRGLSDAELALSCGVTDSVFCHSGGFFAVAKTKESAIKMAKIAISEAK